MGGAVPAGLGTRVGYRFGGGGCEECVSGQAELLANSRVVLVKSHIKAQRALQSRVDANLRFASTFAAPIAALFGPLTINCPTQARHIQTANATQPNRWPEAPLSTSPLRASNNCARPLERHDAQSPLSKTASSARHYVATRRQTKTTTEAGGRFPGTHAPRTQKPSSRSRPPSNGVRALTKSHCRLAGLPPCGAILHPKASVPTQKLRGLLS
jgi:hypothetical protein